MSLVRSSAQEWPVLLQLLLFNFLASVQGDPSFCGPEQSITDFLQLQNSITFHTPRISAFRWWWVDLRAGCLTQVRRHLLPRCPTHFPFSDSASAPSVHHALCAVFIPSQIPRGYVISQECVHIVRADLFHTACAVRCIASLYKSAGGAF